MKEGFCYRFCWKSDPRYSQFFNKRCRLVKCMRFGNMTMEFEDGQRISVPRNAVRLIEGVSNGKK